jgi:hypothetical protein
MNEGLTYIKLRIARLRAVSTDEVEGAAVCEQLRLLEMRWKMIWNDELTLDDPMCAGMCSAETVIVVQLAVMALDAVEHLCRSLDILCLVRRHLLYTRSVPVNVVAMSEVGHDGKRMMEVS